MRDAQRGMKSGLRTRSSWIIASHFGSGPSNPTSIPTASPPAGYQTEYSVPSRDVICHDSRTQSRSPPNGHRGLESLGTRHRGVRLYIAHEAIAAADRWLSQARRRAQSMSGPGCGLMIRRVQRFRPSRIARIIGAEKRIWSLFHVRRSSCSSRLRFVLSRRRRQRPPSSSMPMDRRPHSRAATSVVPDARERVEHTAAGRRRRQPCRGT
jgi:hypothetical protein